MRVLPLSDSLYWDYVVRSVAAARRRVYVNQFIVDARGLADPEMQVRALLRALGRKRARRVDVKLLVAASNTRDIAMANRTSLRFSSYCAIPCRVTRSDTTQSHCKYMIIDDQIVLGSHNWEAAAFRGFLEDSIALIGAPGLTTKLVHHFSNQWSLADDVDHVPGDAANRLARRAVFSIQPERVRQHRWAWKSAPAVRLLTDGQYFQRAQTLIVHAKRSIDLAMFYLAMPTSRASKSASRDLAMELVAAHHRGIQVRVVLDRDRSKDPYGSAVINKAAFELLDRARVQVRFDDRRVVTHSKVLVVDGREAVVGSHNWTNASLTTYREVSVDVRSDHLAAYYVDRISNMYRAGHRP